MKDFASIGNQDAGTQWPGLSLKDACTDKDLALRISRKKSDAPEVQQAAAYAKAALALSAFAAPEQSPPCSTWSSSNPAPAASSCDSYTGGSITPSEELPISPPLKPASKERSIVALAPATRTTPMWHRVRSWLPQNYPFKFWSYLMGSMVIICPKIAAMLLAAVTRSLLTASTHFVSLLAGLLLQEFFDVACSFVFESSQSMPGLHPCWHNGVVSTTRLCTTTSSTVQRLHKPRPPPRLFSTWA